MKLPWLLSFIVQLTLSITRNEPQKYQHQISLRYQGSAPRQGNESAVLARKVLKRLQAIERSLDNELNDDFLYKTNKKERFPFALQLKKRSKGRMSTYKGLLNSPERPKRRPCMAPKYMVDLYQRFSRMKTKYHGPELVRSFLSINQEEFSNPIPISKGSRIRKHRLIFNVSSINPGEFIMNAELRLHTILTQYSHNIGKVVRKVSVWEVLETDGNEKLQEPRRVALARRKIHGPRKSGWKIFSLTDTVVSWVASGIHRHILEIQVESVKQNRRSDFDIDTRPFCEFEPLLVVYSDLGVKDGSYDLLTDDETYAYPYAPGVDPYHHEILAPYPRITHSLAPEEMINMSSPVSGRQRRSARKKKRKRRYKRNICRKRRLYISFQDIGWHSWIIAPHGYWANECAGKCYYPIPSHLTPTRYAIVRTLLHVHDARRHTSATCVPTAMGPISILYIDKAGTIVYVYAYQNMVVKECGCR